MTPVDQEFLHMPEEGQYGDCQRAVIASLLDLPAFQVPHFNGIAKVDELLATTGGMGTSDLRAALGQVA